MLINQHRRKRQSVPGTAATEGGAENDATRDMRLSNSKARLRPLQKSPPAPRLKNKAGRHLRTPKQRRRSGKLREGQREFCTD